MSIRKCGLLKLIWRRAKAREMEKRESLIGFGWRFARCSSLAAVSSRLAPVSTEMIVEMGTRIET